MEENNFYHFEQSLSEPIVMSDLRIVLGMVPPYFDFGMVVSYIRGLLFDIL